MHLIFKKKHSNSLKKKTEEEKKLEKYLEYERNMQQAKKKLKANLTHKQPKTMILWGRE
jgi:DNA anti-recombination protein RmuC